MNIKTIGKPLSLVLVLTMASTSAYATEGGNVDYPIGVDTVLPAMFPNLGQTMYLDYMQYNPVGSVVGADGKKAVPGFHGNIGVNAFRFLHTWGKAWGPISFTSGIVVPVVTLNIRTAAGSGSDLSFGDVTLQPFYAEYTNKKKNFHIYAGSDVVVPNGNYNKNAVANIGLNYFTFLPIVGMTWFASKRLQLSLKTTYIVPTINHATDYQSGQSINFDWGIDYNLFPKARKLFFGFQGYALQQTSGDTLHGVSYMGGYYSRVIAVGPQIRYDLPIGGIAIKYQQELAVRNRSKGERIWFQFAVPLKF